MYEVAKSSEDILVRSYQECKYSTSVPWLCQPEKTCLKMRDVQMSHFGKGKQNASIHYSISRLTKWCDDHRDQEGFAKNKVIPNQPHFWLWQLPVWKKEMHSCCKFQLITITVLHWALLMCYKLWRALYRQLISSLEMYETVSLLTIGIRRRVRSPQWKGCSRR